MLLIFELQEGVNLLIENSEDDISPYFRFGPKILLAVVVTVMNEVYRRVAIWLTDKGELGSF